MPDHLDVASVRAAFPALRSGIAFFDSPGGTQTPEAVAAAVAGAWRAPLSNRGRLTAAQRNAEQLVHEARRAMAELLGGVSDGIVFGRSATALTFDVARTLAADWGAGTEVVVTRLDHDANIRPWVRAAERAGASVRVVDFDPDTGELPASAVAAVLSERTALVAVTAASNLIGTRPDVPALAEVTHAAGAELYVDGVHAAAHGPVDLAELGCDFFVCSPYKFFGPHLGVLAADPDRLERLHPDKLLPSSDAVPERFELGTLPYELLAGTTAAVDFLAGLVPDAGPRRERLAAAARLVAASEAALLIRLEAGLAERGAVVYSRAERRTPTLLFDLPGHTAADVAEHLATRDVNAPAGHFYALEASRHLGLGDAGAVRAGLAAYTDDSDVDRLLAGLDDLLGR